MRCHGAQTLLEQEAGLWGRGETNSGEVTESLGQWGASGSKAGHGQTPLGKLQEASRVAATVMKNRCCLGPDGCQRGGQRPLSDQPGMDLQGRRREIQGSRLLCVQDITLGGQT